MYFTIITLEQSIHYLSIHYLPIYPSSIYASIISINYLSLSRYLFIISHLSISVSVQISVLLPIYHLFIIYIYSSKYPYIYCLLFICIDPSVSIPISIDLSSIYSYWSFISLPSHLSICFSDFKEMAYAVSRGSPKSVREDSRLEEMRLPSWGRISSFSKKHLFLLWSLFIW